MVFHKIWINIYIYEYQIFVSAAASLVYETLLELYRLPLLDYILMCDFHSPRGMAAYKEETLWIFDKNGLFTTHTENRQSHSNVRLSLAAMIILASFTDRVIPDIKMSWVRFLSELSWSKLDFQRSLVTSG